MPSDAETGTAPDSRSSSSASAQSIAGLLAAAEPAAPRRLGELIQRLEASGRLRTVRPVARVGQAPAGPAPGSLALLSLIHISEPTRLGMISYAVFCLKK